MFIPFFTCLRMLFHEEMKQLACLQILRVQLMSQQSDNQRKSMRYESVCMGSASAKSAILSITVIYGRVGI